MSDDQARDDKSPGTSPPPLPPLPLEPAGLDEARLIQFRVSVGHEHLVVRGSDRADALREARRRLCLELPRMWDVIERLEDERFQVTELPGAAGDADQHGPPRTPPLTPPAPPADAGLPGPPEGEPS